MARFHYRALLADGKLTTGEVEAGNSAGALENLRRSGARPIEVQLLSGGSGAGRRKRVGAAQRRAVTTLIGELAVLMRAGLPLDRALALATDNVIDRQVASACGELLQAVREGKPLSRAMARRPELFSPVAIAMTEAGEANGQLPPALTRLAEMLEQGEDLRRLIGTSMIYPAALLVIATGVVLVMLLFVVPQFESLFASAKGKLPVASVIVMGASRFLRDYAWLLLGGLAAAVFGLSGALRQPTMRAWFDAVLLGVPQVGELIRYTDTARFARTLGVLVEGEVPLPGAVALARRTIANSVISAGVGRVADGIKEGGGLSTPLAAARVLPKLALGFLRTGEETSQLGPMLHRLADVLDRDIRVRLQRLVGILNPVITVVLGGTVAAIIAAIMSAIIGFNDLAVSS